jgi:hypothetical protein
MYLYAHQDRINVWLFRHHDAGTAKHFELTIFSGMTATMTLTENR